MDARISLKRILLHALAVVGYFLGLPLWFRLWGKRRNIRVLLYHSIDPLKGGDMAVTAEEFAGQIDFLEKGYGLISIEKAVEHLRRGTLPDRPSVAITFDDGYASNYQYAFPLLRERNVRAGIFLLTRGDRKERTAGHLADQAVQETALLSWNQVREMSAEGFIFGSHGVSHARFAGLTDGEKDGELAQSKHRIEEEIGTRVRYFSYPYGTRIDFDSAAESLVRSAGYDAAFSKVFGTNGRRTDLFAIRRIGIEASDTLFTFRAKLNGALGLLALMDLPAVRRMIRWFDSHVLRLSRSEIRADSPILLVSVDFPPHTDGVSTISRELSGRIARRGRKVIAIGPKDAGDREFDVAQPYRVVRVPGYDWGYLRFFPVLLTVPWVVWRYGIRKVFAMNIAYGGILSWGLSYCRPFRYVAFAYGYEFEKVRKIPLLKWAYIGIYERAEKVVTCSREVRERLIEFGVSPQKIVVLYPAVDRNRYRVSEVPRDFLERNRLSGRRILLTTGRLIERKGHDQVLRALPKILARFPEAVYCIVGIGEQEQRLHDLVRALGIEDKVWFMGRIPDQEMCWLYNACDVFVMPSREILKGGHVEGFGIVFLEASACGKPVIGGRSGGVGEAIRDGETGFLVDPNSPDEIAEKVIEILTNPARAKEMGERGRRWVEESFDWNGYIEKAYEYLCGEPLK